MTTGYCHDCQALIDWSKPVSVRVFVRDRAGKEHELCVPCWSSDAKPKAVRK